MTLPGYLKGAALAALVIFSGATARASEPPRRVVSMNLCTDQMAMLIAGKGQLYSVSYLAADPNSSVLAGQTHGYVVNHGLAEEVFPMRPDLVIAGTYSTRTTVALLRRLGFRVEEFAPENSFDDIRRNLIRMGDILGRQRRAAELVSELDARLSLLASTMAPDKSVALYYSNSYTSGSGTLADAIVKATGLTNVGDALGLTGTVRLPLELLLTSNPDLIIDGHDQYDTPALANENFVHPAYRALSARKVSVPGKYMICGAPFTLEAVRMIQDAARKPVGTKR